MSQPILPSDPTLIRDAATIILLRQIDNQTRVLMGQRGKTAAFMPGKVVFPGGAVDRQDFNATAPREPDGMSTTCRTRLAVEATPELASAILVAARRELVEETGLTLSACASMRFVFRAITPPKHTRRFDARFLMCNAEDVIEDLDDFSRAEDELAHLQWVSVTEALSLDLPFVTRIVLAEIKDLALSQTPPDEVPFYDHRGLFGQIVSIC